MCTHMSHACECHVLCFRTLAQFLRQQTTPMPERDILLMFYKMVDALRYLHEHKILHRFVTARVPAMVWVCRDAHS